MGRLSRLPLGPLLIDFLGHMRADPRLRKSFFDIEFPTAVGLGPWLDTRVVATEALSRFGVGFIEIGPVTLNGTVAASPVRRLKKEEALWIDHEADSVSLDECNRRLNKRVKVPLIVRIATSDDEEIAHLVCELDPSVRLIALTTLDAATGQQWSIERWSKSLECGGLTPLGADQASSIIKRRQAAALQGVATGATAIRQVLLCVPADTDFDTLAPFLDVALDHGICGFIIEGRIKTAPAGWLIGLPARERALQLVRRLRERYDVPIIACLRRNSRTRTRTRVSFVGRQSRASRHRINLHRPWFTKENQRLSTLRSNAQCSTRRSASKNYRTNLVLDHVDGSRHGDRRRAGVSDRCYQSGAALR